LLRSRNNLPAACRLKKVLIAECMMMGMNRV
jgi:hypothetical protein